MQHDEILAAFLRAEPRIDAHHRGGNPGYTHVHGPNLRRKPNATRCTNHSVVIECYNGTVCVPEQLSKQIGAMPRPKKRISEEFPTGGSGGLNYGRFVYALTCEAIMKKWETVDEFVNCVIDLCRRDGNW